MGIFLKTEDDVTPLDAAKAMDKAGIKFVPMPVIDSTHEQALLKELEVVVEILLKKQLAKISEKSN